MPGSGGRKTANYLYGAAPKDGTVIADLNDFVPTGQMLRPEVARFNSGEFAAIGSFASGNNGVLGVRIARLDRRHPPLDRPARSDDRSDTTNRSPIVRVEDSVRASALHDLRDVRPSVTTAARCAPIVRHARLSQHLIWIRGLISVRHATDDLLCRNGGDRIFRLACSSLRTLREKKQYLEFLLGAGTS